MQDIFRRREKKYLITSEQGAALQKLIASHTVIDQQGEYLIQDLYFDTANWDIISKSIERPLYKEKLRLRLYGQYNSESQGFLEMKRKYEGIVYKRRIAFPLGELKDRSVREIVSEADSQISSEISYFLKTNPVSEKIHIAYKRMAYTGIEDKGLRITFDRDIAFHLCSLNGNIFSEYNSDNGRQIENHQIIEQNQMLMEIKTADAIPLWLTRALGENNIFPVSFSKFGVCYIRHISGLQGLQEHKNVA
jgi:SPX domain protein involved in polyphosphate accumulation